MYFPFSLLKLPNNGNEEYSKIIIFISFYFIHFPPPEEAITLQIITILKLHDEKLVQLNFK